MYLNSTAQARENTRRGHDTNASTSSQRFV